MARAYVIPSIFWGLVQVSLTHRLGVCIFFPSVVCVSFPGGFVVQDGLLFPHVVSHGCCYALGLLQIVWSHFGHDRAKNDLGVIFPC